jgi:RNA polymerase sigma factor (sigma-70 family)
MSDIDESAEAENLPRNFEPPSRPPTSHDDGSTAEPSQARRWLMNVVLCTSGVLTVPLLVSIYLTVAMVGSVLAVIALGNTDGLVGSTFGGGFALASVVGVIAVVAGLVARYRWRRDDSKGVLRLLVQPSVALVLAFFLPAALMTLLESAGVDVPDFMSTATLIGSIFYLWFVLPFAMGRGSWKLFRLLQRWGAKKKERAAQLSVAVPIGVLVAASALFSPIIVGADDDMGSPRFPLAATTSSIADSGESESFVEQTRQAFGNLATEASESAASDSAAASSFGLSGVQRDRSQECFTVLAVEEHDGQTELERQRRRAHKKLGDPSAAHDVVHDALDKTCTRHSARALKGRIVKYYNTVVGNEIKNYYRNRRGWTRFADAVDLGWIPPSRSDFFVKEAFENCMDKLEPEEEALLRVYYIETDKDYSEVEHRFEVSYGNARQKVRRAREKVKSVCQEDWK